MKFGAASVGTAAALTEVVHIIASERQRWDRLIVVVAALGGITDALIEATRLARLGDHSGYRRVVADIRTRHLDLIAQLPLTEEELAALQTSIDRLLFDALTACQSLTTAGKVKSTAADWVVGVGEQLAARIVATLLRHHNLRGASVDATEIIITQNGPSRLDLEQTRTRIAEHLLPLLDRDIIPVITGFIAGTLSGQASTLGRGGSGYTASILSACTETDQLWIWTNVDGLMTADTRQIPTATVIPQLSYDEAAELAYFGARILHAHMIDPLRERKIPLYLKNIAHPEKFGTLISATTPSRGQRIKAVTSIIGIGLVAEQSGALTKIVAQINDVLLKTIDTPAEVMLATQSSSRSFIGFVIPTSAGLSVVPDVQVALAESLAALPDLSMWRVLPVSFVTAVGAELAQTPRLAAQIFAALDHLPILAVARGVCGCSLSVVVNPANAREALVRLHRLTEE